ncbi:MAG: outer membrane protein assembly factor BamD [Prevotellaceae bacterium]|jgi:outer membrane protein assembly factor BamD|nr:outer membrane protein assembly factor BamD [Prevotellaceae bacterium]
MKKLHLIKKLPVNGALVLLLLAAGGMMTSCNTFEKLLKSSDFALKYREAGRYYDMAKYDKAVLLYENVIPFYRSTQREDTINIRIARSYYYQHDYEMAQYYYEHFSRSFPRSGFIEEAEFMQGMCSYNVSRKASLDQAETLGAIQAFNLYLYKYPHGEKAAECREKIAELQDKLSEKAYQGAKIYYTTEHYKAAVVALKNCVKAYPESKYREDMLFLILKSSYLHAENSVADKQRERFQLTIDEYYNLISEFPNTKYKNEAEKMYKNLLRHTKGAAS